MEKRTHIQGHRRFLPCNHPFRKQKKAFNGEQFRPPPQILSGKEVLRKINVICNSWGKKSYHDKSKVSIAYCRKKKLIFFDLEYWKYLHVHHNLDVIDIEKMFVKLSLVPYSTF